MDDFAQLPSDERRVYFEQASSRLGLSAQVVEKDFWVCWSLRRLFSLDKFQNHLTFKGGTSLSKVYHAIERFSEDIDVAIERSFLGFGGDNEPEKGSSVKEQQRRIERLKDACHAAIADRLEPQLRAALSVSLADEAGWSLSRDPADKDDQTLLFRYPAAITTGLSPYFLASVKFELGARSDHFPVERATLKPYMAEMFPDALPDHVVGVRVLAAERTFWEKATILHMLHHAPEGRNVAPRMSRHYYDVVQLSRGPVWDRALAAIDLLDRVAAHKRVFFRAAWAKYEEAVPGTLRLVPREHLIGPLRRDYDAMQPMFFREPPPFAQILTQLSDLENRVNEIKR